MTDLQGAVREWLKAKERETTARREYEESRGERVELERKVMDLFTDNDLSGLVVDGRQVYLQPREYVRWREGVDYRRDPEVRRRFEEAGLGHLWETRITSTDLKAAMKQLSDAQGDEVEGEETDGRALIDEYIEVAETYGLGNRKAKG